jgi:hypothetical protein
MVFLHARFRLGHNKERISNKWERRLGFNSRLRTLLTPPYPTPSVPAAQSDPPLLLSPTWLVSVYIVYPREGRPRFSVFTCHLDDDRDEGTTCTRRTLRSSRCARGTYTQTRVSHTVFHTLARAQLSTRKINNGFNSETLIGVIENRIVSLISNKTVYRDIHFNYCKLDRSTERAS